MGYINESPRIDRGLFKVKEAKKPHSAKRGKPINSAG